MSKASGQNGKGSARRREDAHKVRENWDAITWSKPQALQWHYGPTPTDPDPGKMWCYACGGEVWWIKNGAPYKGGSYVCLGCKAQQEDEPQEES